MQIFQKAKGSAELRGWNQPPSVTGNAFLPFQWIFNLNAVLFTHANYASLLTKHTLIFAVIASAGVVGDNELW